MFKVNDVNYERERGKFLEQIETDYEWSKMEIDNMLNDYTKEPVQDKKFMEGKIAMLRMAKTIYKNILVEQNQYSVKEMIENLKGISDYLESEIERHEQSHIHENVCAWYEVGLAEGGDYIKEIIDSTIEWYENNCI